MKDDWDFMTSMNITKINDIELRNIILVAPKLARTYK